MPTQLTVSRTESITPTLRRVWFRSDDLSAFAGSVHTDRYVKLVFPEAGGQVPGAAQRTGAPRRPASGGHAGVRTYTALFPDVARGTVAIDFVVHGDEGVAGPWAAAAVPGDRLLANGPGGGYAPDPAADWHLLAGDESALPAITAALAALPEDAVVRVVAEVESAGYELQAAAAAGRAGDVRAPRDGVGRRGAGDRGPGAGVVAGAGARLCPRGGGRRDARAAAVPAARARALGDQVSISGYWRRGRSEEGFRQWKSELAQAEGGAFREAAVTGDRAASGAGRRRRAADHEVRREGHLCCRRPGRRPAGRGRSAPPASPARPRAGERW